MFAIQGNKNTNITYISQKFKQKKKKSDWQIASREKSNPEVITF